MIEISEITKRFGSHTAVDIPCLRISSGQTVGLVGNNGAGKTTLFRLILDLAKADTGTIHIDGTDTARSEQWKWHTGAYLDEGFLIDFLTAEEYFDFVGKANSLDAATTRSRLESLGRLLGDEILGTGKLIREYSAGNKQKIGIAAALMGNPSTLILDEPFNYLDPSSQITLKRVIQSYREQTGATIIISSHNLQHTIDISTRVLLMHHGQIIKDLSNTDGSAATELNQYFAID